METEYPGGPIIHGSEHIIQEHRSSNLDGSETVTARMRSVIPFSSSARIPLLSSRADNIQPKYAASRGKTITPIFVLVIVYRVIWHFKHC
jgi:hypothetical protein